jgi:hypothetical protein
MPEIAGKGFNSMHLGVNFRCNIPRIHGTSFCSLNINKMINLTFYSMMFGVWKGKMEASL